jgi:hypothetical protein
MMRGMVAVDDVIASLPKERQKAIGARGNELLAKVRQRMTLSELRKGRKISQAKWLSRWESGKCRFRVWRRDPRLSTMQRTVAAMGGHLTMIVTFPDQEPVVLVNPLVEKPAAPKKKRRA